MPFFGKVRNIGPVSREKLFFMFRIFQSRPINSVIFLPTDLDRVVNQKIKNIYVGGTVTHLAIALDLHNQIAILITWCGYDLLDIYHCLNYSLVRREGSNEYKIVIPREVVHEFTLPNPEKASVHNREKWRYPLENQDESPTPPQIHLHLCTTPLHYLILLPPPTHLVYLLLASIVQR